MIPRRLYRGLDGTSYRRRPGAMPGVVIVGVVVTRGAWPGGAAVTVVPIAAAAAAAAVRGSAGSDSHNNIHKYQSQEEQPL